MARPLSVIQISSWTMFVKHAAAFVDQTAVIQFIGCPRLIVEIGRLFVSGSVQCHGIDVCRHKRDVFKAFTDRRHVLIAETRVSHDQQWLFPRVLFLGPQFHKLGGYHPFAALLQVLIASFTKILSAVSAQAESEHTGGTKHGYPVVAGVSPAIY
jgi:hypothetical protein